jgi:hypothetical protein
MESFCNREQTAGNASTESIELFCEFDSLLDAGFPNAALASAINGQSSFTESFEDRNSIIPSVAPSSMRIDAGATTPWGKRGIETSTGLANPLSLWI